MLTRQQISHYQTFGFLTLPKLLAPEEVETLQDEFERGLEATTHCNASTQSSPLIQWSNLKPETCFRGGLLEDPRFAEVAEELCGEDVIAFDHQLYHAAWGASDKRRQLTISYLQAPKSTEEIRAAREAGQVRS